MTNKDILLQLIRENHIYTEQEIKEFEGSIEGIPMHTYAQWISKGYEVNDNVDGYETVIWIRQNLKGGKSTFKKKKVIMYSGKQVYKADNDYDQSYGKHLGEYDWKEMQAPYDEWENIGRDRIL